MNIINVLINIERREILKKSKLRAINHKPYNKIFH